MTPILQFLPWTSAALSQEQREAIAHTFERLCREESFVRWGMASEDGVPIATAGIWSTLNMEKIRLLIGEHQWRMSIFPGVRAGDVDPGIVKRFDLEERQRIFEARQAERIAKDPDKVKRRSLRQKAMSFIHAIAGPKVDDDTFEERLAFCMADDCGHLREEGGKLYCNACGCGKWKLAELSQKLRFANLECPLEDPRWGPALDSGDSETAQ